LLDYPAAQAEPVWVQSHRTRRPASPSASNRKSPRAWLRPPKRVRSDRRGAVRQL